VTENKLQGGSRSLGLKFLAEMLMLLKSLGKSLNNSLSRQIEAPYNCWRSCDGQYTSPCEGLQNSRGHGENLFLLSTFKDTLVHYY
jgi:hypothetical protein